MSQRAPCGPFKTRAFGNTAGVTKLIWSLVGLLVGSWVVGVVFKIAEDFIHFLLVIAGILGIGNLVLQMRGKGPATQ